MKNYKVRAIKNFKDKVEQVERIKSDEFDCTKERYEYLKEKKAVELIGIIEEIKIIPKKTKPIKIVETNVEDLSVDPYENFEVKEKKPKTKKTTKKTSKK